MKGDLIETFKIINGISNYDRRFFNISSRIGNLLSTQISNIKSTNQSDVLLIEKYILEQIAESDESKNSIKED